MLDNSFTTKIDQLSGIKVICSSRMDGGRNVWLSRKFTNCRTKGVDHDPNIEFAFAVPATGNHSHFSVREAHMVVVHNSD
jgi:hypothetical protein